MRFTPALACALLCGANAAAIDSDTLVTCRLAPDGAFDAGGAGWLFTPTENYTGDAIAWAGIGIADGSGHPSDAFDHTTLALQVYTAAGILSAPGTASAEAAASIAMPLTGTILRLRRCGGFEHLITTGAGRMLDVRVTVEREDGRRAEHSLYTLNAHASTDCGEPLTILGTLDAEDPTLEIDLGAAGLSTGDQVVLRISITAGANVLVPCQFSETFAVLLVDVVELCGHPPCPADFDGDGYVTGLDFDTYAAAFEDGDPSTDFDGDGFVTGLDFDEFVAAFENGCG